MKSLKLRIFGMAVAMVAALLAVGCVAYPAYPVEYGYAVAPEPVYAPAPPPVFYAPAPVVVAPPPFSLNLDFGYYGGGHEYYGGHGYRGGHGGYYGGHGHRGGYRH